MIRECYAVELLDRETADMMLQDIGTRAFRQFDRWGGICAQLSVRRVLFHVPQLRDEQRLWKYDVSK